MTDTHFASDGALSVNLHFDIETSSGTVCSRKDACATLYITPKQSGPLRIRVPAWAARDSVRLSLADNVLPLRWDGSFLVIEQGSAAGGSTITLAHDLPEKQTSWYMFIPKPLFDGWSYERTANFRNCAVGRDLAVRAGSRQVCVA